MVQLNGNDPIQISHFAKSFGDKVVHRDVTFSVRKGECLGLIGGSGTGKSVILRSIIGLERPDSGSLNVLGHDIAKCSEHQLIELRKRVAYVFQGGALFDSMTVFDNLAYPLREHTKMPEELIAQKIREQLAEFGLSGNEFVYPADLSGGMQKRVGLARSIIMGPEVVLYDEPTAGLDPYNTIKICEMIARMKSKGVTSILVTHDMGAAFRVCDRIAMLMNGRIQEQGTREELDKGSNSIIHRFIQGEAT
jgi:phospholipid/cholesterol/gamma-HCH transport system ATP-binding protein